MVMLTSHVNVTIGEQRLQVDDFLVRSLEVGNVLRKRFFKLTESADAATCVIRATRLLFSLPVNADQLVVFVVIEVILPHLICEERQVKVEAHVLRRRVVELVVVESVQQAHHVQFNLDGEL